LFARDSAGIQPCLDAEIDQIGDPDPAYPLEPVVQQGDDGRQSCDDQQELPPRRLARPAAGSATIIPMASA